MEHMKRHVNSDNSSLSRARDQIAGSKWCKQRTQSNPLLPNDVGTIGAEELRHILSHFGELMDTNEVDEYIAEADIKCPDLKANGDKTGNINYVAFVGVMLDLTEDEIMAAGLAQAPRL